MENQEVYN